MGESWRVRESHVPVLVKACEQSEGYTNIQMGRREREREKQRQQRQHGHEAEGDFMFVVIFDASLGVGVDGFAKRSGGLIRSSL